MTKPPGQRHRQNRGLPGHLLASLFFGGLSMSARPSPRPTLTDGWLLQPGVVGGGGVGGPSLQGGRGDVEASVGSQHKTKKKTAGNRSR